MSARHRRNLAPFSDEALRRSAHLLGPSSASAKALAEMEERRARGEDVCAFWVDGCTIVVGPPISALAIGDKGT